MSVTSLEAASFLCQLSGWNIKRTDIHKLLYISAVIYMGRYKEPLILHHFDMFDIHSLKWVSITNECFVASIYGPILPALDKRVSIFGARNIRNVFESDNDIDINSHKREVELLTQCYESLGDLSSSDYNNIVLSKHSAWRKRYMTSCQNVIRNEDIYQEYQNLFTYNL